jgi:hypothetical protein
MPNQPIHPNSPNPPHIDPTANVIALHEAGTKRVDDLRDAADKLVEAKISHLREMITLNAAHAKEIRGIDKELRVTETDRVDAIRQVDQLHQSMAAKTQQEAILALERTTQASAETLRSMVENTAKSLAAQTAASMTTIDSRLAALEKQSYENTGKEKVSDPILEKVLTTIEGLQQSQSINTGRSGGMNSLWALIVGGVALAAGIVALASRFME